MELSGFVDVGLALVTVYLLLSLLASTINEVINTGLKIRANKLAATLKSLLDSDGLHQKFVEHGLIGGIGRSSRAGLDDKKTGDTPLPSYLDSKTFADALLGVLANLDTTQPVKVPALADIEASVQTLQPGATRDAILSALAVADNDITRLRDGVAAWFDASMDRLSGAFVRQMKLVSFLVGAGLALLLNVDSIDVASRAWKDPDVRAVIEQTATKIQMPAPCTDVEISTELNCELGNGADLFGLLRPLPVGWVEGAIPWDKFLEKPADPPVAAGDKPKERAILWCVVIWWLVLKVAGLFFTALAVSLGAPFWFDMLQKVMNVRGAGSKPPETPVPASS